MEIRPLGPEALAAIRHLLAESLPHDRFSPDLIREKLFENPRPALDRFELWGAFDEEFLAGVMQSVVRPGQKAWLGLFAVDRGCRRRGVARALLASCVASWRHAGATEAEVLAIPGNYFAPGLDPRYTAALAFLERRGFARFKDCVNLAVDLSRVPDPTDGEEELRAAGIEVRRADAGDDARLDAFFAAQFGADWRLEAELARRVTPPGLHLALLGGRVVAFAAHSGMNREWGWFGPMGTAREAEGRGIGRVLLLRCLADLRVAGHASAVIPWVGPIAFYARQAGARVDRVFWRYRLALV